jgi:hypothetical protein
MKSTTGLNEEYRLPRPEPKKKHDSDSQKKRVTKDEAQLKSEIFLHKTEYDSHYNHRGHCHPSLI